MAKQTVATGVPDDNSPTVIAYRVGQLEKTVREGFENQTAQLKSIVTGFVTEKEFTESKLEATEEYKRIWKAIREVKDQARWWVSTLVAIVLASGTLLVLWVKK